MRGAAVWVVALGGVLFALTRLGPAPAGHEGDVLGDTRRAPAAVVGASGEAVGAPSRAGFPTMAPEDVAERRTWSELIEQELGESAAVAAGDAWTPAARIQLLAALRHLRDAARARDTAGDAPDSDEAIAAAQRHREAALAADALSRELFGMPLGAFVQRTQPGTIEEVPLG